MLKLFRNVNDGTAWSLSEEWSYQSVSSLYHSKSASRSNSLIRHWQMSKGHFLIYFRWRRYSSRGITKNDIVKLPVSYLQVWQEVIAYVYTGKGPVTSLMRANILYLDRNAWVTLPHICALQKSVRNRCLGTIDWGLPCSEGHFNDLHVSAIVPKF